MIRSFAENAPDAGLERSAFLWIGRIVDYKDPLAYAELAARVPQARFWMVADVSDPESVRLVEELRGRARQLPNLALLEPRPREDLFELYDRSVAVVNTSRVEGFPNTFMEGWARGAPALSLRLDPDEIIRRNQLGRFAAGSEDELARAAHELWESRRDSALEERAHAYIEREHSPAVIGARWERLVRELQAGER
jgi:glycosyltransferase involved in cell wall biosynthesis